jgi:hypothetical protein
MPTLFATINEQFCVVQPLLSYDLQKGKNRHKFKTITLEKTDSAAPW